MNRDQHFDVGLTEVVREEGGAPGESVSAAVDVSWGVAASATLAGSVKRGFMRSTGDCGLGRSCSSTIATLITIA